MKISPFPLPYFPSQSLARVGKGVLGGLLGVGAIALTSCTDSLENSLAADPSLSSPQPTETATPQPSPPPSPSSQKSPPSKPTPPSETTPNPEPSERPSPDISPAPTALQPYLEDWAKTDILPVTDPNQPITRRTLARWLFDANNALYGDRPAQQIRPAPPNTKPTFQDINPQDPDFPAIQGLTEAGIIPSPLTGNTATVKFNPDALVNRETLLQWKVLLDFRSTLPPASVDAIAQTWGFQDASKIDPAALKSVLADYQNSDLANIRRAFGFTTLLQPKKTITQGEAAAALWHFGLDGQGKSAADLIPTDAVENTPN